MWNLNNKVNKQNRNKLTERTNWRLPDGTEVVRFGEKGEGIKKGQTARHRNRHSKVKHSTGNVVGNIVITMYAASWALDLGGGPV